jgi:probable addiction module antidote protein
MKVTYAPFDAADYLDSDTVIAEYLTAAAEDSNFEVFLLALGNVAKAKGMARIAKEAGLGRESLYKALAAGAHPRYETVSAVLRALGVKLAVVPESRSESRGNRRHTTRTVRPAPRSPRRRKVAGGASP